MRVMGLDLSLTSCGVATANVVTHLCPPAVKGRRTRTPDDDLQRLVWLKSSLARLFETERPQLVVIEDFAGGHTPQSRTAFQLGELAGVVKVMLHAGHVPIVLAPSAARCRYATGKGSAKKEEVLVAARDRLGYDGTQLDEADALVLRALGCDAMGQPLAEMPATHRAAIDKVEWPAALREAV